MLEILFMLDISQDNCMAASIVFPIIRLIPYYPHTLYFTLRRYWHSTLPHKSSCRPRIAHGRKSSAMHRCEGGDKRLSEPLLGGQGVMV